MIGAGGNGVQVWVATTPVDMRKSLGGLAKVVRASLGHDPPSGNLFVFRNRSGQRVKVLWWDKNGLALYYKRLDRGTFVLRRRPRPATRRWPSRLPTWPSCWLTARPNPPVKSGEFGARQALRFRAGVVHPRPP